MDRLILLNVVRLYLFVTYIVQVLRRLENPRRERRWWVRPDLTVENRLQFGAYATVFTYFQLENHEQFYSFTRMSVPHFQYLFQIVGPYLCKRSNRAGLPAELRLAAVLNYLAHGTPVTEAAWFFRNGRSTMYSMVPEVCQIIFEKLGPTYFSLPQGEDWQEIANSFNSKWDMPNCIGALDGRHIEINSPPHSGTQFYNYKNFFSTVLMATCDASYRFTWANVGGYGSSNDPNIFRNSDLGILLEEGHIALPQPTALPGTNFEFPYYFIADGAFPLKEYFMTPFPLRNLIGPQRVYNKRLSRARRMIETSFGILIKRWRLLDGSLNLSMTSVEIVVMAALTLHNFVITVEQIDPVGDLQYADPPAQIIYDNWPQLNGVDPPRRPARMRDTLVTYFSSPAGRLPWLQPQFP